MARSIMVPANWAARIPGQSGAFYVSFPDAKNASEAARSLASELKEYGVPAAAVQGWSGQAGTHSSAESLGSIQRTARTAALEKSEGVDVLSGVKSWFGDVTGLGHRKGEIKDGVFKPFSAEDSPKKDWGVGRGEESSTTGLSQYQNNSRFANKPIDPETLRRLRGISEKATSGKRDQFLTDAQKAQRVTKFDPDSRWSGNYDEYGNPIQMRTEMTTGIGGEEPAKTFNNDDGVDPAIRELLGSADKFDVTASANIDSESVDSDQIISLFRPGGRFGDAVSTVEGIQEINPLLGQLLDLADNQNNRVSLEQVADVEARSRENVAVFNKDAAIEIAKQNNLSDTEVARLTTEADTAIATAAKEVDKYIADQQRLGTEAHARATTAAASSARLGQQAAAESGRLGQEAAAESGRLGQEAAAISAATGTIGAAQAARFGQEAAAESMAGGQLGAAEAAAGAASPFGFMQQATTNDALQTPEQQLKAIYDQLNAVGLAQAGAANIGAQDNAFSFAAGAGQGRNPVTGELDFDPNQIGQIAANTPAAFAAKGQEAAARAGATGFGALLSGDAMQQGNANAILRAQAANNPYAATQLGQDNSRIDQILRGGLSPEQRIAEINAGQSGQNFANQLNFMSNPSAVGFATEQGLFGGGNNQVLQDINNSPEGNVPGSYLGLFNSPTAAGAGGGATQSNSGGTTQNISGPAWAGGNFNPNEYTNRNKSDEQIGFDQGAASARGQTPSEYRASVQSFTPQGL